MHPRVVAVAHLPPPVHGMAAAVDRLVAAIEEVAIVRRVSISAPGLDRSPTYHLTRMARVLRALGVLLVERRRSRTAVFSCDAGTGMVYTLALVSWSRLLGYRMYLQHHSYAYLDARSPVLALLVRLVGERCEHLVSCPRMRRDLRHRYPSVRVRVVGIATGLVLGGGGNDSTARTGRDLVLGFLGNVTAEKGIGVALETVRRAGAAGVPVSLRVAGPVVDAEAERLLAAAADELADRLVQCGPLYGPDRDAFLDGLDVFLFPSHYAHESFGLAAWEAMARGVPLLACRSGCLTAEAIGSAGFVIERNQDFPSLATEVLRRWCDDPRQRVAAVEAARNCARLAAETSRTQTARFCRDLAEGVSVECEHHEEST